MPCCRAKPSNAARPSGRCRMHPRSSAVLSGVVTRRPCTRVMSYGARSRSPPTHSGRSIRLDPGARRTQGRQDLQLPVVEDVDAVQPGRRPVDEDRSRRHHSGRGRARGSDAVGDVGADVDVAQHPSHRPSGDEITQPLAGESQLGRLARRERAVGKNVQVGTCPGGWPDDRPRPACPQLLWSIRHHASYQDENWPGTPVVPAHARVTPARPTYDRPGSTAPRGASGRSRRA